MTHPLISYIRQFLHRFGFAVFAVAGIIGFAIWGSLWSPAAQRRAENEAADIAWSKRFAAICLADARKPSDCWEACVSTRRSDYCRTAVAEPQP